MAILTHWTLFWRETSQWCTVLYYNVHSNIYRCVIILSGGLFIRMSRKGHEELLPFPKACIVLRCDWRRRGDSLPSLLWTMCLNVLCRLMMGWGEEQRELWMTEISEIKCCVVHWEELHQYRSVDSCSCKQMNIMLDSDQFKRGKLTFMEKKKWAQYNLRRDCICDAKWLVRVCEINYSI